MREKTKPSLALADIDSAWSAFFKSSEFETEESLAKQGWKTVRAIAAESGRTAASMASILDIAVQNKKVETKKAKIRTKQGIRDVGIYRPIMNKKRP